MRATLLDKELSTFEANKGALLASAMGKFVLIKGEDIFGTFDTRADAVGRGYEEFGNEPFLVKEVLEMDVPAEFASHYISI